MASPAKLQRFGGSKVRSGCITCKARHVKCDEGHPVCRRCVKAGRICGGYSAVNQGPKYRSGPLVVINYKPPLGGPRVAPDIDPQEQRSLFFFQSRTAIELAGSVPTGLWSRNLLQIAQHEPAIRHAIIALGSLHEHFELLHDPHAAVSEFAMQQYSKALQKVVSLNLGESEEAVDVALISCVLFAAFESLQGHYKSALTHISSGVKILSEQETIAANRINRGKYLPREVLMPLFVRMDTQAMEIGDEAFRPTAQQLPSRNLYPVPTMFSSIEEAHVSFDIFFNHVLHFLQSAERAFAPDTTVDDVQAIDAEHTRLVQYLQLWSTAFEMSCFPQTHPAVLILQIYRILMKIMAGIELVLGEMYWDRFIPDFGKITDLAEAFMHYSSIGPTQTTTSASTPGSYQPSGSVESTGRTSFSPSTSLLESVSTSTTTSIRPKRPKPKKVSHGFMGIQPEATPLLDSRSLSALEHVIGVDNIPTPSDRDTISQTSTSPPASTSSSSPSPPSLQNQDDQHNNPKSNAKKHKPTFTLTLGIITPLYMTCSRCRDPYIRRRALHVLLSCNRKEGIWDSIISGRVAERIISIEEAGASPAATQFTTTTAKVETETGSGNVGGRGGGGVVVTDASQIPEHARIRELEVVFMPDRQGKVRYCKSTGDGHSEPEQFTESFEW